MIYVFIVLLAFTLIFLILNKKKGNIKVIYPDSALNEEDLIEIPSEKAYYDETNKFIIDLKKEIDKNGISKEDVEKIKNLKKSISEQFNKWGSVQETLENMIKERTSFIEQSNFYPSEYAFDINRMKMEIEKAREYQLNNPLKPLTEIEQFIDEQNLKIRYYKELKDKVESIMPKLETYEKSLKTKKDTVAYFNKKQALFLHLHKGDLNEANKSYKSLRSLVKNTES